LEKTGISILKNENKKTEMPGCPPLNGYARKKGIDFKDVSKTQLRKGIKVELEHTDDVLTAATIALDHLAEIPNYYTLLAKMEQSAKKRRRT
jgi:hypothetical protein